MTDHIELVVISGRSGSGKTVALHALEDLGFYCIDNLPLIFLQDLIKLAKKNYPKLAVSIDVRNLSDSQNLANLSSIYDRVIKDPKIKTTVIYIDADDQVLIKRYSENRRLHPLSLQKLSLNEALVKENEILKIISSIADLRIDTTNLSIHELCKQVVTAIQGSPDKALVIIFESFGFKDGIAKDADFVFDARFLPNPYWEKQLRSLSGLEKPVKDFFKKYPIVEAYINQIDALLMSTLKLIEESNRSYLTVAVGCTGGFHRSVYIAQSLADKFKTRGINIQVRHRSLMKNH